MFYRILTHILNHKQNYFRSQKILINANTFTSQQDDVGQKWYQTRSGLR